MNAYLTSFNESERADYLVALAHMVGADGVVTSEEILALRNLCKRFIIGPDERGRVMAATVGSLELPQVIGRLGATPLKFGLLLDLCLAAYWDGHLADEEVKELNELGAGLEVSEAQLKSVLALAEKIAQQAEFSAELQAAESLDIPRQALAMAACLEGDKPLG
jgi:uncharacterized tellurite resistance protein B-like protein